MNPPGQMPSGSIFASLVLVPAAISSPPCLSMGCVGVQMSPLPIPEGGGSSDHHRIDRSGNPNAYVRTSSTVVIPPAQCSGFSRGVTSSRSPGRTAIDDGSKSTGPSARPRRIIHRVAPKPIGKLKVWYRPVGALPDFQSVSPGAGNNSAASQAVATVRTAPHTTSAANRQGDSHRVIDLRFGQGCAD